MNNPHDDELDPFSEEGREQLLAQLEHQAGGRDVPDDSHEPPQPSQPDQPSTDEVP
ncbi:hypothetical protein PZ938_10175 [Luteipulveratus sp. YIM 133132]|uniref:hypothetical protein n=1 Tax=Luteipulveratus flavus TaxID=3031728 RepID=UPI0023B1E046|nr:hypothetical protein [Luteipulveratus sp. YIM 133132]MDE9365969.1 hypothetical protein [Luteipulveratus sp. YIM 133132]